MTIKKTRVISCDNFLNENGAYAQKGSEPALHRTPGGFPKGVREKHLQRVQIAMKANNAERARLRIVYKEKVEAGELRPPTRREELEFIASGHPDNTAVQAAKRLLEKKRF